MYLVGWLSFSLILGFLAASQATRITPAQQQTMRQGIAAGQRFTQSLTVHKGDDFKKGMNAVEPFALTWTKGFKLLSGFLSIFEPEDTRILDAITEGFAQVNKNLDQIKSQLEEIKNIIKWQDMKIKFADIEFSIRLLDSKLMSVMTAPDKGDAIYDFLRTYDAQYKNAGFALFDSIVSNDQIFSRNLLKAAMVYSKNHRPATQRFMKGLLSLMVKAANIEIAEERFNQANRGESEKWIDRLKLVAKAMQNADSVLNKVWPNQFKSDMQQKSAQLKSRSHSDYAKQVHTFLKDKYSFCNWHVVAYDAVGTFAPHTAGCKGPCFVSFRQYKRNIFIASSPPRQAFDVRRAASYIKNYPCNHRRRYCRTDGAKVMYQASPWYGSGKLVLKSGVKYSAVSDRSAQKSASLIYRRRYRIATYNMFYFG